MTDSLGADVFVAELVKSSAEGLMSLLPAIIFVVGCLLALPPAHPGAPSAS